MPLHNVFKLRMRPQYSRKKLAVIDPIIIEGYKLGEQIIYPKSRSITRIIISSSSPLWQPILIKEIIATTFKLSNLTGMVEKQGTNRSRALVFLNIEATTPSLANRSCASLTPGFLSGLRNFLSYFIKQKQSSDITHCSTTLFLRYAFPISTEDAVGGTSSHE